MIVERKRVKWNLIVREIMTNKRRNIGVLCLMIGTFLNPLGYAEALAAVMTLTGLDYWTTTYIFYAFAVLFFLASFFLLKINPISRIRGKIKMLRKKKSEKIVEEEMFDEETFDDSQLFI